MSIDKSWTTNPYRNHPEFQAGLKAFIEKSKLHVDSNGKIRCACESEFTPTQERATFEKVLGERRGHIRGIGRKPSGLPTIPQPSQPSQPPSQPSQLENLRAMLADPACRDELYSFFQSQNNQGNDGNGDEGIYHYRRHFCRRHYYRRQMSFPATTLLAATIVSSGDILIAATIIFSGDKLINSDEAVPATHYRRRVAAIISTGDIWDFYRRLLSPVMAFFLVVSVNNNIIAMGVGQLCWA
ncbi:unnamed protein product [Lactuca saligna]|uniref:Uncharacterized protein n=1 Tax=Lactuca saligna TaxID=75948 RepID=A0AA35V8Y7_LACSI|nr:unnamed protein product [Lactuca saligna]